MIDLNVSTDSNQADDFFLFAYFASCIWPFKYKDARKLLQST